MTREEQLQEALIEWVLAGGSIHGLFVQIEDFVEGLAEFDKFEDGGSRAQALGRLHESLDHVEWLAAKVDRAGLPEVPPHMKPGAVAPGGLIDNLKQINASLNAPALPVPIRVLIESFVGHDGRVSQVRASAPVQVSIWKHDEVREGLVSTALRSYPLQPIRVLVEDDLPKSKIVDGLELFLTYDHEGRPTYCSVPGRED